MLEMTNALSLRLLIFVCVHVTFSYFKILYKKYFEYFIYSYFPCVVQKEEERVTFGMPS